MSTPENIHSAEDVVDYTAPAAALNLTDTSLAAHRHTSCRSIRPAATGNLLVKMVGSDGEVRTIAVTAGVLEPLNATSIEVGSVGGRIYW